MEYIMEKNGGNLIESSWEFWKCCDREGEIKAIRSLLISRSKVLEVLAVAGGRPNTDILRTIPRDRNRSR